MENLPLEHGTSTSKRGSEVSILRNAIYTANIILMNTSTKLLKIAIRHVQEFVTSNIIPSATKCMGQLVSCCISSSPRYALEAFLPLAIENIMAELASSGETGGASSLPSGSPSVFGKNTTHPFGFASLSDATLHWYQCILYSLCSNVDGKELLPFRDIISAVLRKSVDACLSYRGYKWSGRLIRDVVKSLGTVFLTEFASLNPEKIRADSQGGTCLLY